MAPGKGSRAVVRRIESSPSFQRQFATPAETEINLNHPLWNVLPIGRKMTSPRPFRIIDRNGENRNYLAESFKTPYNIFILLYPTK
jgi:hypothetical protein